MIYLHCIFSKGGYNKIGSAFSLTVTKYSQKEYPVTVSSFISYIRSRIKGLFFLDNKNRKHNFNAYYMPMSPFGLLLI